MWSCPQAPQHSSSRNSTQSTYNNDWGTSLLNASCKLPSSLSASLFTVERTLAERRFPPHIHCSRKDNELRRRFRDLASSPSEVPMTKTFCYLILLNGKNTWNSIKDKAVPVLLKHHATCGSKDTASHILATALHGGEWIASHPGHFTPSERSSRFHWIGGWVDPEPVWISCRCWKLNPDSSVIQPAVHSLFWALLIHTHKLCCTEKHVLLV